MSSLGRVGITRPAGRGQHLVAELSGLGLESVEVPLVEISSTMSNRFAQPSPQSHLRAWWC